MDQLKIIKHFKNVLEKKIEKNSEIFFEIKIFVQSTDTGKREFWPRQVYLQEWYCLVSLVKFTYSLLTIYRWTDKLKINCVQKSTYHLQYLGDYKFQPKFAQTLYAKSSLQTSLMKGIKTKNR